MNHAPTTGIRHILDEAKPRPAVTGCGSIGLLVIQIARALGASPVIGIDMADKALALAKALGADVVVDSRTGDPVQAVKNATGGIGAAASLDTVGSDQTLLQSLQVLRRSATG